MKVKYYLAPLEGITTYIYRRAYHTHYRPMEKYFTPFLVPHTKKDFNTREKNDILPEHNPDIRLLPEFAVSGSVGQAGGQPRSPLPSAEADDARARPLRLDGKRPADHRAARAAADDPEHQQQQHHERCGAREALTKLEIL